ncbi:hypothetical protein HDU92_005456 [Lobulomyces angularis]|nr:hypothetical protein HDU92_005456 [Lobulomyces angularis]
MSLQIPIQYNKNKPLQVDNKILESTTSTSIIKPQDLKFNLSIIDSSIRNLTKSYFPRRLFYIISAVLFFTMFAALSAKSYVNYLDLLAAYETLPPSQQLPDSLDYVERPTFNYVKLLIYIFLGLVVNPLLNISFYNEKLVKFQSTFEIELKKVLYNISMQSYISGCYYVLVAENPIVNTVKKNVFSKFKLIKFHILVTPAEEIDVSIPPPAFSQHDTENYNYPPTYSLT